MQAILMRMPVLRGWFAPKEDSRGAARDRLKSALVGDRQTVAPQLMSCLQRDMEECMARYLRADKEGSVYKIVDKNGKMMLTVEVPVLHILRQGSLPEEAVRESAEETSVELKLASTKLRKGRRRRSSEGDPAVSPA
jgi:septum formation topological specificity factor MinE